LRLRGGRIGSGRERQQHGLCVQPLNRLLKTIYADDVFANPREIRDANGTEVTNVHDGLDRLTERSIVPGPGVSPAEMRDSHLFF
jgi:hypothetical protein